MQILFQKCLFDNFKLKANFNVNVLYIRLILNYLNFCSTQNDSHSNVNRIVSVIYFGNDLKKTKIIANFELC